MKNRSMQRGVSLIEVLVAMLILTVGLLGFAGIQTRVVGATEFTYTRTQALGFAQDIMERMRMNGVSPSVQSNASTNASNATYTTASNWSGTLPAQNCLGSGVACTSAQMALYDIAQVRAAVESSAYLPEGKMLVEQCAAGQQVCVYVSWAGTTSAQCKTAAGALSTCILLQGT